MDNILNILSKFISCLILTLTTFYMWSKLTDKKINYRSYKPYISIALIIIVSIFNYYIVNQFIRILFITIVLMLCFKFIFNDNSKKCIITPIVSQLITMVAEMLFVLTVCLIFNMNGEEIINTQFGQFFSNMIISFLSLIIIQFSFIEKFYKFLLKITDKITNHHLMVLSFSIVIIANILTMILYYKVQFTYLLIFNTGLTLFCFAIVLYSFKNKNNYIKVYDKYNTTLNSLKEYEDILDRYRVSNHENKNQLLTIRNMVPKTNKKTISYIDKIVENKLKDNDRVMLETAIIPAGGLRGLIYSKVLAMKDLNIDYELEFSKEIKTVDLISKIDDSMMLDICKIIGVYIDNAIEAVKSLDEKYINIEIYLEDKNLVISISNNYKGKINIDKIENIGYTTKSNGHGYGLSLTKEIIDNNNRLKNEKKISKEAFTQILKIKM